MPSLAAALLTLAGILPFAERSPAVVYHPLAESVYPFGNLDWFEDIPHRDRTFTAIIDLMLERCPEGIRFSKADLEQRVKRQPNFCVYDHGGEISLHRRIPEECGS